MTGSSGLAEVLTIGVNDGWGDDDEYRLKFGRADLLDWALGGISTWASGNDRKLKFYVADSGGITLPSDAKMVIDQSGKVGIGTTGPDEKLHIEDNVDTWLFGKIRNLSTGIGAGAGFLARNDNNNFATFGLFGSNNTTDANYYQNFATIDNDGAGIIMSARNTSGVIKFMTNGTIPSSERMRINSSGKVGIGTTNPGAKLYVNTNTSDILGYDTDASAERAMEVVTGATQTRVGQLAILGTNSPDINAVGFFNRNTGGFNFIVRSNSRMVINESGNVGIGTTSPSFKLHVNGTAFATGAAGALSDIRHKKNVQPIFDGALNIIDSLRPVTYEWKDPEDSGMEGTQIGFIAQEVEKVLPGVVMTLDDEDQTKALKYNEFIPVLVKAVKELKAENDQLKNKLTAFETRQAAIEDMQIALSIDLPKEKLVNLGKTTTNIQ